MKFSDSVSDLFREMLKFAQGKETKLLVIVDQMNSHLTYFDDLKTTLTGFSAIAALQEHRVLMSSSTSGTTGPIFGDACFDLKVFDHFITPDEITLLKARYQNSTNLDLLQGGEWSFLHAVNILSEGPKGIGVHQ